jgi:hypothetical protein
VVPTSKKGPYNFSKNVSIAVKTYIESIACWGVDEEPVCCQDECPADDKVWLRQKLCDHISDEKARE